MAKDRRKVNHAWGIGQQTLCKRSTRGLAVHHQDTFAGFVNLRRCEQCLAALESI